jgi:hypothetical protein
MHNLYFPWIRFIIFALLVSFPFAARQLFQTEISIPLPSKPFFEPEDLSLKESDFQEYDLASKQRSNEIEYILNGSDRKLGNLIAIEPSFLSLDFYSEENFKNSLIPLFEKAKKENAIDRKTIIILPEHIGTGLYFLNENRSIYFSNIDIVIGNLKQIHKEFIEKFKISCKETECKTKDVELEAIVYEKKDQVAEIYHRTFSELAKEYSVTIIAGSILLPNPKIEKGNLISDKGPIFNVSLSYLPNGKIINQIIKKVHLNEMEKNFIQPGEVNQDLVISVPGWKVGVLLGIDSFYSSMYAQISKTKVDGIVSPSSSFFEEKVLDEKSQTIDLQESEDWYRYSIKERFLETKAKVALQLFWKGKFGDIKNTILSFSTREGAPIQQTSQSNSPKILNLYF